jgi:hypothetical protein
LYQEIMVEEAQNGGALASIGFLAAFLKASAFVVSVSVPCVLLSGVSQFSLCFVIVMLLIPFGLC